jgi:hypothetical protein
LPIRGCALNFWQSLPGEVAPGRPCDGPPWFPHNIDDERGMDFAPVREFLAGANVWSPPLYGRCAFFVFRKRRV